MSESKTYCVSKKELKNRKRPVILLIDVNNILWRTAAISVKNYESDMKMLRGRILNKTATPTDIKLYEDFYSEYLKIWRNVVFNMIRNIVNTHKPNSVIICCDAAVSWRELIFPYYKGERKLRKAQNDEVGPYSTKEFYAEIDKMIDELDSILTYHKMKCKFMEADDIIAILSQKISKHYDIIISSTDKDFADLITEDGSVKFWEHHKKEFVKPEDKNNFDEMIMMGDVADGIPRLHDDDDSIVMYREYTEEEIKLDEKSREQIKREFIKSPSYKRPRFGIKTAQKILAKLKEEGKTLKEYADEKIISDNYFRNTILFSLRLENYEKNYPIAIKIIRDEFLKLVQKKQSFISLQKYFAKNRMIEQLNHIEEFILPKFES